MSTAICVASRPGALLSRLAHASNTRYSSVRTVSSLPHSRRSLAKAEDQQLILLCQQGDPAAWDTLFRRYEKPLYRFAMQLTHNYDDAAEVVAQVCLRLLDNIHTFRHEASFTSWLYCIVRNVYVDTFLRPRHRTHLPLDTSIEVDGTPLLAEASDPSPSPEDRLMESEKQQILRKAIHHLPDYQREMMQMYHGEGCSYEDIERVTGLSLGTIKSRLCRGRRMLRERLEGMQDILLGS
jgi:RNA polymerase sigma-70 factor (ECF subfamily)